MPPLRRPASPLSLEIYSSPAEDIDSDGILGSDDEQDESERRVRRQRIEKLAESYVQGSPLFILSASLKGPFEDGWVNPWRKRRCQKQSERSVEESVGPVVQETERRYQRYAYESREQSEAHSERRQTSANQMRSGNGARRVRSVQGTPKRTAAWVRDNQLNSELRDSSVAEPARDDWLKRDSRRPGFRDVNPPTSPTTTISARVWDARNRSLQPDYYSARPQSSRRLQSPAPISEHRSPVKNTGSRPSYSLASEEVEETRRSEPVVDSKLPNARVSPSNRLGVAPPVARRATSRGPGQDGSFCVVSSSSQLPKFEYRRRKSHNSDERQSARQKISHDIPIRSSQSEYSQENMGQVDQQEAPPNPASPEKPVKQQHIRNPILSITGPLVDSCYDSRTDQGESRTTHGTTSYNLPSAQPVPPFPTMTDHIPSLHSTALPATDPGHNGEATGSVPYLSTQAAFLQAQKSFQDELASDEEDSQPQEAYTTSSRKRRHSQFSVMDNSHGITPFRRLNDQQLHRNSTPRAAAAALPSTQHLVEAITPFTFSTDRKRHAHFGTRSGTKSSSKKPKTASPAYSRPQSPEPDWRKSYDSPSRILSSTRKLDPRESPSSHSSRRTAWSQSSGFLLDNGNLDRGFRQASPEHEMDSSPVLRPAALPLNATGPSASQDGQGGMAGESFNLSQAIADAGSWLQDSFDVSKDME